MSMPLVIEEVIKDQGQQKGKPYSAYRSLWMPGAFAMLLPALYNRYPLIYPDTMTYLGGGRPLARAVFLHKLSSYYGERSFFYSLAIVPLHWNATPWPIVVFQALLTTYILWLVWRSVLPQYSQVFFLGFCIILGFATSVSWYSSLIMPDILGPVLYLCAYLLLFARESLSHAEHGAVAIVAWWAITSHGTHLMLIVTLLFLLIPLSRWGAGALRLPWRVTGEVVAIVLLGAAAQAALHTYLYGEVSLFGEHPPFLMARVIADGPGRWYLERNCGRVVFTICSKVRALPSNADDFLWQENGVWQSADDRMQRLLRKEEIPFVVATVSTYPRQQLLKSAENFLAQLTHFGLRNFGPNAWTLAVFDSVFPGGAPAYLHSRETTDDLPYGAFASLQEWTVVASLMLIAGLSPQAWSRGVARLCGLEVIVLSMVIANAFFTALLSMVEDRFQGRIIWLLPLLAGLLLLDRISPHQRARGFRRRRTGVNLRPQMKPQGATIHDYR